MVKLMNVHVCACMHVQTSFKKLVKFILKTQFYILLSF